MSLAAKLISRDAAPVFVAAGRGAEPLLEMLPSMTAIETVLSPRHATVLLIAGVIPETSEPALLTVHDQLPHPRATVWWCSKNDDDREPPLKTEPEVVTTHDIGALNGVIAEVHRRLWTGARQSESDLKADEPPEPWQGKGDHGQGGEGMMGGKPYGRPMAMLTEDRRDGLKLDGYAFTVGPFLHGFPAGLTLHLTLQGDVIQHCEILSPPLPPREYDIGLETALIGCEWSEAMALMARPPPAATEAERRDTT